MSKKIGIILSLILSIIFTLAILYTANQKYTEATKTVEVIKAEKYIPAGSSILPSDVTKVKVPERIAEGLAQDINSVIGKASKVSILEGQYIYKDGLSDGYGRKPGYTELYIPTDLSSSAVALAGEHVNIHLISKNNEAEFAPILYKGARVLHSLDANGKEIDPAKAKELSQLAAGGAIIPVSIGIEISEDSDKLEQLVQFASKKMLYLTKVEGD